MSLSHVAMSPPRFAEQSLLPCWGRAAGTCSLTHQPRMWPSVGAIKGSRRGNLPPCSPAAEEQERSPWAQWEPGSLAHCRGALAAQDFDSLCVH